MLIHTLNMDGFAARQRLVGRLATWQAGDIIRVLPGTIPHTENNPGSTVVSQFITIKCV